MEVNCEQNYSIGNWTKIMVYLGRIPYSDSKQFYSITLIVLFVSSTTKLIFGGLVSPVSHVRNTGLASLKSVILDVSRTGFVRIETRLTNGQTTATPVIVLSCSKNVYSAHCNHLWWGETGESWRPGCETEADDADDHKQLSSVSLIRNELPCRHGAGVMSLWVA